MCEIVSHGVSLLGICLDTINIQENSSYSEYYRDTSMSFGISISECIALTELITAAYHCWSRIPKEIAAFLSLVQDLKTQAKGLEANRLFETQILLPSERESLGDWISTTWNILKSFQQIEQHARADGQLVQRLRWLFNRKLKSLAEQISRQTDALKDFKQDLVVRAVT